MGIYHKKERRHYDWKTQEITITYKEGDVSHVGKVIRTGTDHSVRIMSDVWASQDYALVWDDEAHKPYKYILGTHDSIDPGPHDVAEVDATPETLARFEAYQNRQALEAQERSRLSQIEDLRREHNTVARGKRMKVVRGRKVPKGTTGVVFWIGRDNYGYMKVGLGIGSEKDDRGYYVNKEWVRADYLVPCEEFQVPEHLATPICDL